MFITTLKLITGLILIGLIVFLHELSHYVAARLFKVDVDVLSFGIGPKVLSKRKKDTEFRISLFPFGGYCRMKGSADIEKALRDKSESIILKESGSYFAAPPFQRIMIFLAGPLSNYILAFILLLISSIIPVERVSNKAYIAPVSEYESLFNAGLEQSEIRKGDLVLAADGRKIDDYQMLEKILREKSESMNLTIERDNNILDITITPDFYNGSYRYGITLYQEAVIGSSRDKALFPGDRIISINGKDVYSTLDFYSAEKSDEYTLLIERDGKIFEYSSSSPFPFSWFSDVKVESDAELKDSPGYAFKETNELISRTAKAIGALITLNITDAQSLIAGPIQSAVSISDISTEAFSVSKSSGIRTLLYLLAIVSIGLCIGNILPIPILDGGRILITLAEIIRGKELKARTYLSLEVTGLIFSLLIMIVIYYFDIKGLFFRP